MERDIFTFEGTVQTGCETVIRSVRYDNSRWIVGEVMAEGRGVKGEGQTEPGKPTPKRIGIAIVEHHRRYLIGVRQTGQVLAGYAEFPGGKCRPDEPARDCAVRECLEETGLTVEPFELLARTEFEYPHATVDLHFWLCRLNPASKENSWPNAENGFGWLSAAELAELNFPDANATVVGRLIGRFATRS
jgi:8-oxo-dGTP diphosphatase